jgi:hypothetical protein
MKRTTAKDIMQIQKVINTALEYQGKTERVSVEWPYGRPRAYLREASDGDLLGELSPRLSTGPMADWLTAFEKGLRMGYHR